MSLQIISINNNNWDNIVKSFENHDVYYLSGYVKAFQLHGDGEPLLFYFDNGNTKAINVTMKRDISKDIRFNGKIEENKYFDLITPYGYGGFLIEGNDYKSIKTEYTKWCTDNNIVSEFVRFHPLLNNHIYSSDIYETSLSGYTICMDITDKDKILYNITSKNRNMIKKAQKSNLSVFYGQNEYLADEFIQIYNSVMDKNNAGGYYYFEKSFYESILNDLKDNFLFFYVQSADEIIAMSVIIFRGDKIHYHLSGAKKQYQHLASMNLLLYEAAVWGAENGYKEFHLGGGRGAKQDSLYTFKKSFNKQDNDKEFYTGKAIFNKDIYNSLVNIREHDPDFNTDTNYFPKYRG